MSRHPDVADLVAELAGVWTGEGEGEYPTIDSFRYRETTEIAERPDHPSLRFEQRTWKRANGGEVVSHWEIGLLRLFSDGTALFRNAQPGRVETMSGTWAREHDGWVISLRSTGFAGDDRVVAATRTFRLASDELSYEMSMETISTHELSLHLRATLSRIGPG